MKDMTVLGLLITLKSHLVNTVIMHDVSEMEKCKSYEAELLRRFEASKCCGNCKHSDLDDEERVCCLLVEEKGNQMSDYCSDWQTDNLSRAEREGK